MVPAQADDPAPFHPLGTVAVGLVRRADDTNKASLRRSLSQPWRYVAMLAGALPVFAFPGTDWEFLAWFGLVPMILILRAAPTAREGAVRGWWAGAGYLLAALYWLIPNIGPALLGVAVVLGAPWAGFGYAAWHLLRPRSGTGGHPVGRALAAMVVLPSIWVVIELIRSWHPIGGPWAVLGATQWQHPVVLSLAALGGIWLISFVLVLANTGLAIAITDPRPVIRMTGALGTLLTVASGPVTFALLPDPPPAIAGTGRAGQITIALVQPGLPRGAAQNVAEEERLTRQAHNASLVVWGESSVAYDLGRDPSLVTQLAHLAATAPLLVSTDSLNATGQKSKTAVLIGPNGVDGTYVKTRLVPFGEYIPFRSLLGWLTKISRAAPQNMISGTGAKVLATRLADGRALPFGVLICFESAFPDMSRVDADRGAQIIIYQTSDATFQASWAPEQHASMAAVRAVETGRPAVQAALTGDSAAFDARGRLLAWADTHFRGVTYARVTPTASQYRTPFDRFGDYVPWLSVAAIAIALTYRLTRREQEPGGRSPDLRGHATTGADR